VGESTRDESELWDTGSYLRRGILAHCGATVVWKAAEIEERTAELRYDVERGGNGDE
jgi:hypothetical protein